MNKLYSIFVDGITLIEKFISNELRPSEFAAKFIKEWAVIRDKQWANICPEDSLLLRELSLQVAKKVLPPDEYMKQLKQILGRYFWVELAEAIDAIHSACYDYFHSEQLAGQEAPLRKDILKWQEVISQFPKNNLQN